MFISGDGVSKKGAATAAKMAGGGGGGGGGGGLGRSVGGSRQSNFLDALDRSNAKRDGGFKNNWSFDHSEESEGNTEKDEASLLSIDESDGTYSPDGAKKPLRYHSVFGARGDSLRTYTRRNKTETSRMLKGNPVGLNMLGGNRKISENIQNMSCSETVGQARRCPHVHAQTHVVKTAAQRKEYPPNILKIDGECIRFSRSPEMKNVTENRDESGSESDSGITRKVQLKRHCTLYHSGLLPTPATKKCATHLEGSEQNSYSTVCLCSVKTNENQTKCNICGKCCIEGLQRQSVQSITLSDTLGSLQRESIHENSAGQKPLSTGLNAKKFYGSSPEAVSVDFTVRRSVGPTMLQPNGKISSKITGNVRQRNTTASELNDPIVLSSDDEEDNDIGNSNQMESISPRPADSACSSPAPSTGRVEAALKENTCELQQRLTSITADTESAVILPRKARMKDQFGNVVPSAPVKRRKVISQEIATDVPMKNQNSFESVILNCRSIRIGTLRRMVVEPVIFCLDYIKINLEESENDTREIQLKTSELTKCEWCGVRKLPVVFLQTIPAACQSLRSHLKMNKEKDNVWYDCKGANPEEQYIILIFETGLDHQANAIFEKIISDIGIRNNISNFFVKITFEEANSRLVAFTKSFEDTSRGGISQKEGKTKHVSSESKMQLQTLQFQFFDDDESGEPHTVFIGPIEKLIVYPPPPAKGGISVTNEDLHCLNEGEFLNDVIIDFYLKYLVLEKLKREDADRIHVFSSFFYKRLNQRERRNPQETSNLTIQQKRHGRVKTWTRHVDIFEKDFIFVPLNEAAHWFLAVICFPGLKKPIYEANPNYQENASVQVKSSSLDHQDGSTSSPLPSDSDLLYQSSPATVAKKVPSKKHIAALTDTSTEAEENGLQKIKLNYSEDSADSSKINEDELIDFSEDQDNQDNSSGDDEEEDDLADDNCNSELGQWHLRPTICKQPCILLMDSLRGPSRSNVVRTLREYLQVEWEVRKGSKRSFSKEVMKGSNPKVPQQNNFSDCGVYVLQYVESFFETPIVNFELPMNLTDWFPRPRMKTKREEIRNIILKLQEQQNKEKKGQKDINLTEKSVEEGTEQFISSCSD